MTTIPAELLKVAHRHTLRSYDNGATILYQGEVPRQAYLVASGVVKLYDIGANGDEKIVSFLREGDVLPLGWLTRKAPVSLYYYDAFTPCKLYAIPREEMDRAISRHPAVMKDMYERFANAYVETLIQVTALEQSKGVEKIVYTLQYLLMRFGAPARKPWMKIQLRLTHQDLANMTGLTRETTSTELNKLRRRGILTYKDQYYSIHKDKLLGLLSTDEFTQLRY